MPSNETQQSSASSTISKSTVFQDLPLLTRSVRLNLIELKHSDKQIVNELVYRWCRILTRKKSESPVTIIDMIGAINPIRLASVLKRDIGRMRLVNIVRQCKINSTFVTISAYLKRDSFVDAPKLLVIYQDEFYILKTLDLVREFIKQTKSQVLVVVPTIDERLSGVLAITSTYQVLKCDFCVDRRDIGPAPPDFTADSYQSHLNQIYFQRPLPVKNLPDRILGELREDGLHLQCTEMKAPPAPKTGIDTLDGALSSAPKRAKTTVTTTMADTKPAG